MVEWTGMVEWNGGMDWNGLGGSASALPRITIGKERRTHWPIPWQLKFNFVVRAW